MTRLDGTVTAARAPTDFRAPRALRHLFQSLGIIGLLAVGTPSLPAAVDTKHSRFALTISGGVSLGMYEAGLNWVLIEELRRRAIRGDNRQSSRLPALGAVTGASAGAINALVSALRYCEANTVKTSIDHNLFRYVWVDVGLGRLLPEDDAAYLDGTEQNALYLPQDSILSRNAFDDVFGYLIRYMREDRFEPGCAVSLGFSVSTTRPVPYEFDTRINRQSIPLQRFVIPIRMRVDAFGRAGFSNDIAHIRGSDSFNHILLPEEDDGHLSIESVLNAALASSAFPLAFSRIELEHCIAFELSEPRCREPRDLRRSFFIDGGVFDNIPLHVALDAMQAHVPDSDDSLQAYIYIDPDIRRGQKAPDFRIGSESLSLRDQIRPFNPILNAWRYRDLHDTLTNYFALGTNPGLYDRGASEERAIRNERRMPLITNRYFPLTGELLGAFGAFFDRQFREHDYLVGVYDGLVNVSQYECIGDERRDACAKSRLAERIDTYATRTSDRYAVDPALEAAWQMRGSELSAARFLRKLACIEWDTPRFCRRPDANDGASVPIGQTSSPEPPEEAEPRSARKGQASQRAASDHPANEICRSAIDTPDPALTAVFRTLNSGQAKIFPEFVDCLDRTLLANPALRSEFEYPDYPIDRVIKRMVTRLTRIEADHGGEWIAPLRQLENFASPRVQTETGGLYWSLSKRKFDNLASVVIPEVFGFDVAQQSLVLSWNLLAGPFSEPTAGSASSIAHLETNFLVNFDTVKHADIVDHHWAGFEFSIVYDRPSPVLSTLRAGVMLTGDIWNDDSVDYRGKWDTALGAFVSAGLLQDRLRLTWGNRYFLERDVPDPLESTVFRIEFTNVETYVCAFFSKHCR